MSSHARLIEGPSAGHGSPEAPALGRGHLPLWTLQVSRGGEEDIGSLTSQRLEPPTLHTEPQSGILAVDIAVDMGWASFDLVLGRAQRWRFHMFATRSLIQTQ